MPTCATCGTLVGFDSWSDTCTLCQTAATVFATGDVVHHPQFNRIPEGLGTVVASGQESTELIGFDGTRMWVPTLSLKPVVIEEPGPRRTVWERLLDDD